MPPPAAQICICGTRRNRRGLNPRVRGMFEHGDGIELQKCGVRGGIVVVENPSPPLPQFRSHATHTITQTLQNLHVESCVDSLTLRCEFVVHNSMAVKKPPTWLWFFICCSVIFSVSANLSVSTLCSATSARCRTRRSTIRRLWWPFPRIHRFPLRFSSQCNTLSVATFAQEWAV